MSRDGRTNWLLTAAIAGWLAGAAVGAVIVVRYDATAGAAARGPTDWPTGTTVPRVPGRWTLLIFLHPQCACSRATLDELARLTARCQSSAGPMVDVAVLMDRPPGTPEGWERSGLWQSAAAIPAVLVASDVGGAEAARFGAATSGQAMLFDPAGRLAFAGGITPSRGHAGDNPGSDTIVALVRGERPAPPSTAAAPARTPVYGCALFDTPARPATEESR